ncbi:GLUG motif-containing protein [Pseudomonas chlororaphis]|uniref:Filamentous hemagglutinin n=1 Tax=Pseudomonas chlororaphis TaxID=587753 RepID=A0A1Q8EVM2_9PSED|nr:GLUG motif-containing protein [Pseudomonas chlororaphis]OLF55856.1 filamentous hemagglutinin [Pseudomonas chlororaphis]
MNKSYALVWNQALGCWNVASEWTRRRGKAGRSKAVIAAGVSLLGLLAQAPAFALPSGADIVAGDGGMSTSVDGKHLTIDQQSNKLITHWNDFNVGADERVSFQQPGRDAVALNRVIGTHGSDIQGRIDANGQVFLINPNGVLFGKSAQVNVGGLVVSTQNLADKDFLDGNLHFTGNSSASISNAGTLAASDGGSVALLGAQVSNNGVIQANLGNVVLGAGKDMTLNFDGNGLLNLQISDGAVDALVQNGGLIKADGGQVLMTAKSADSLLKTVVSNQGTIEARTLQSKSGRIVLDGGDRGIVQVAGKQDASALGAQGNGGVVENRGAQVDVQLAAQVDTRADKGETGSWKIRANTLNVASQESGAGQAGQNNLGKLTSNNSTLRTETLTANLNNTHIELTSGNDLSVKAPLSWSSGNTLSLNAERGDVRVDAALTATGDKARLALSARNGSVRLNDDIRLTGAGAGLELNTGNQGHAIKDSKAVTLSGAGATFRANGQDYLVIQDLTQLRAVDKDLKGRYVLGNKIAGNGASFLSLADRSGFYGVFDGLGNSIDNLSVYGTGAFVGLFSSNAGEIRNLNLDRISVSGARSTHYNTQVGTLAGVNIGRIDNVKASNVRVTGADHLNTLGGLVALNLENGSIANSSASGSVIANSHTYAMGGLVGENIGNARGVASIDNSHSDVALSGHSSYISAGGLVGVNRNARITNSSSAGSIALSGDSQELGGLVGLNEGTSATRLTNVSSSVSVKGTGKDGFFGGLIGHNNGGTVTNASATGSVTGNNAQAIGGLIGYNNGGTVTNASASGDVSGVRTQNIGGLIGFNIASAVTNVSASGKVTGNGSQAIGGLIGRNRASRLTGASASGDVLDTASLNVGGLVGLNESSNQTNVKALGNVTGGSGANVGGLIGLNSGSSLTNASASGKVTGNGTQAIGGLIGQHIQGSLTNASAIGEVMDKNGRNLGGLIGSSQGGSHNNLKASGNVTGGANANVGGLIGLHTSGSLSNASARGQVVAGNSSIVGGLIGQGRNTTLRNTSASGAVTGGANTQAGGLVGNLASGSIANSSATGDVEASNESHVGGLVGWNNGQISNASASGKVTGNTGSAIGGLVGGNSGSVRLSSASGKIVSLGADNVYGGLIGVNLGQQSLNSVEGEAAKVPMIGRNFTF